MPWRLTTGFGGHPVRVVGGRVSTFGVAVGQGRPGSSLQAAGSPPGQRIRQPCRVARLEALHAAAADQERNGLLNSVPALLARQRLRATGGDGSHMCVEDAVSAQFSADILAFAKPAFERLRRTRHTAQYFDPAAAPVTESDAAWAIAKAAAAVSGVRALLQAGSLDQFG
jgi:hypothetical protein